MDGNKHNFKGLDNNNVDSKNLVNGRPVYYLRDASDIVLDELSSAGMVYCFDCRNITLRNLTIEKNNMGILISNTTRSRIINCTLMGNQEGIVLVNSNENILLCNSASRNQLNGIMISNSPNNIIEGNLMASNSDSGIVIEKSKNNTLRNNRISGSKYNFNS